MKKTTNKSSRNKINLDSLIKQQNDAKKNISLMCPFTKSSEIKTVLGLDIHFINSRTAVCAGTLFQLPEVIKIKEHWIMASVKKPFPYIPGFLSFRELPFLLKFMKSFKEKADLLLCDAHGIAHPRGAGLAAHLGVALNTPAVGCAKSHLFGKYDEPPPGLKGSYQFIKDNSDNIVGIALRSKEFTKPLFISPGHLIGIESAGDVVMACLKNHRIPEPLRHAHNLAHRKAKSFK